MSEAIGYFWKLVALIQTQIEVIVGISTQTQIKISISVVVILLVWVLSRLAMGFLHRRLEDVTRYYRYRKIIGLTFTIIGTLLVVRIWFGGLGSLPTYFGLLSAGLAIALQDLVMSLAGWGFIHWRRPFRVGDRIEIGEIKGDVIDIRPFQFSLLEIGNWVAADQSTGRVLHIPNSWAFKQPIANYTVGFEFIWNEISVVVTFESNWEKAKGILSDIAEQYGTTITGTAEQQVRQAARSYLIYYNRLTPIVWTSVIDFGVNLTIRYICKPRERRAVEQRFWEDVLRAFGAESDIDFAYPTQRFYDNRREGKSGTGGSIPPDLEKSQDQQEEQI